MMQEVSGGRRARITVVALVALTVGFTASCSTDEPPAPRQFDANKFLGQPVKQVYNQLGYLPLQPPPEGIGFLTYDLSPVVTGKPATGQPGDPSREWMTLAACYAPAPRSSIALGVIPMADSTPQLVEKARSHAFDGQLTECAGSMPTFTIPAS